MKTATMLSICVTAERLAARTAFHHITEEHMQYVLLAYEDDQQATLSNSEREAFRNACRANDEALRNSGHLLTVEALGSCTATTVRFQHGKLSITVGPLAAIKQQLIGIFTITARDLNEAIQVAATMPQARGGPIEVRPIVAFDEPMYEH
jgi:hypothetical protein